MGPVEIVGLVAGIIAIISAVGGWIIYWSKLGYRVSTLETNVNEIKDVKKEIVDIKVGQGKLEALLGVLIKDRHGN